MRRQLGLKILTVLVAVGFALLAAEVVLRLTPRRMPIETKIGERPTTRNQAMPSFRGEAPKGKSWNTYRVAVLGDSYTWGSGVYADDAYPKRLERRLATVLETHRPEVISWSRPGWNTREAWRSIEPRLDAVDPDLVIVGYCLNDAEPTSRDVRESFRAARGLGGKDADVGTRQRRGIERWSVLLGRTSQALRNLHSRRIVRQYYADLYTRGDGWAETKETFAEMKARLESRGTRILMVIHPVFDSELDRRYRYRTLHQTVRRAANDAGISVIDLLPHYEGIDARRLALVPFTDAHPNELAHRIAADVILDYLLAEGWLSFDSGAAYAARRLRMQRRSKRRADQRP